MKRSMHWASLGAALAAFGVLPADDSRPITVKGSDTMVIMGQHWAEAYMKGHPGAKVQVTGGGSGTGIAALLNGTTDVCNASRQMKDAERRQFKEKCGVEVLETPVAMDGIAIYVHQGNPVPSLSLPQLKGIYTGKIRDWKELGGSPGSIILYGRENNSGTYEFFKEHVLGGKDFVEETQTMPGTASVINAVTKDAMGIGYGGVAFAKGVKRVPVRKDENSPPVENTKETVQNRTYPISRFLYCYTSPKLREDGKAYLAWMLGEEGQKVVEAVGYFPLPKAAPAGDK